MKTFVPATPHAFPHSGDLRPSNTAIVVIDMQVDFCCKDGFMDRLGADVSLVRSAIEPIRNVLAAARAKGYHIVHTREGFRPDLSDLQPWKQWANPNEPVKVGDAGPLGRALVRGEPCWDFVPELKPEAGEPVFDKSTYGVFMATNLDMVLRNWGVTNLVLTGTTTDCCVTSILREALDLGYDCMVLEDCVGSPNRTYHDAALTLMRKTSGVFGCVSDSNALIETLSEADSMQKAS